GASLGGNLSGISATNVVVVNDTQITATLVIASTATLGAQSITVTTSGGTSNAVTFTVNPPTPTLNSINPSIGVQGTSVGLALTRPSLLGSTLNLPAGVTLIGAPSITATQITASVAVAVNAPTGVQALSVTTTGGTSNALAFTVFPPAPVLTTITPSVGVQAT